MQGGYCERMRLGKRRDERTHDERGAANEAEGRRRKQDSTEAGSAYRKRKRLFKRLLMVTTEGCYRGDSGYERG